MTHHATARATFTPARLEALKANWEAGLEAEEIKQRLNTLPGDYPVSSARAVRHKATDLGLMRPEGWRLLPRLWTPARLELLRNLINLIPDADVLERINALPGPAVKNIRAMREKAQRSGYLAAQPRQRGPQPTVWTDERRAYLRENYGRIRPTELLHALQAMAGEPIPSSKTVRNAARSLNIPSPGILRLPAKPKTRPAARPRPTLATSTPEPEPRPLTIEEQDAIIVEKLARIEAQAMKLFSRRESAATVSGSLKIPLREAFRLQAMHREKQKEAA
jgi:hypothetical protein